MGDIFKKCLVALLCIAPSALRGNQPRQINKGSWSSITPISPIVIVLGTWSLVTIANAAQEYFRKIQKARQRQKESAAFAVLNRDICTRENLLNVVSNSQTAEKLGTTIQLLIDKTTQNNSLDFDYFRNALRYQVWDVATKEGEKICQDTESWGKMGLNAYLELVGRKIEAFDRNAIDSYNYIFQQQSDNSHPFREQLIIACDLKTKQKMERAFQIPKQKASTLDLAGLYNQRAIVKKNIEKAKEILTELNFTNSLDALPKLYTDYCVEIDKHINLRLEEVSNKCKFGEMPLQNYLQKIIDVDDKAFNEIEGIEFKSTVLRSLQNILKDRCRYLKNSAANAAHLREIFKKEENSNAEVETLLNELGFSEIRIMYRKYYNENVKGYWTKINEATIETQVNLVEEYFKQPPLNKAYQNTDIRFYMANNVVSLLLPSPLLPLQKGILLSLKNRRANLFICQSLGNQLIAKIAACNQEQNLGAALRLSTEIEQDLRDMLHKTKQMLHNQSTSNVYDPYVFAYYVRLNQQKDLLERLLDREVSFRTHYTVE